MEINSILKQLPVFNIQKWNTVAQRPLINVKSSNSRLVRSKIRILQDGNVS